MTTPTILSDVGAQLKGARVDRSGAVRSQRAVAVIPASTAATTIIGMVRFEKGFTLEQFALASDDLDTGTTVTLNVGYVYDDNTNNTNAPAGLLSASTIAQAGGSYVWPVAAGLLVGPSFTATADGWLTVQVQAGPTTTAGNLTMNTLFSYDA